MTKGPKGGIAQTQEPHAMGSALLSPTLERKQKNTATLWPYWSQLLKCSGGRLYV